MLSLAVVPPSVYLSCDAAANDDPSVVHLYDYVKDLVVLDWVETGMKKQRRLKIF